MARNQKVTVKQTASIVGAYRAGVPITTIAKQYSLVRQTVYNILYREGLMGGTK